jgi:hypothetical protein
MFTTETGKMDDTRFVRSMDGTISVFERQFPDEEMFDAAMEILATCEEGFHN